MSAVMGRKQGRRLSGSLTEDKAFQKRITGQPVGAMHSTASDFSGRKQALQARRAVRIGMDTSHLVMRAGRDGNPFFCHVDIVTQARRIDRRKPLLDERRTQVRRIQIHVTGSGGGHFRPNRTGDNVSGRQLRSRMVPSHEQFAFDIAKATAFSSNGFGEKERGTRRKVECRRMKLDEFHVFQ